MSDARPGAVLCQGPLTAVGGQGRPGSRLESVSVHAKGGGDPHTHTHGMQMDGRMDAGMDAGTGLQLGLGRGRADEGGGRQRMRAVKLPCTWLVAMRRGWEEGNRQTE